MARFPVSGSNATALASGTASTTVVLLTNSSGRVFWLRGVNIAANATDGPLQFIDQSGGACLTGSTAAILTINIPLLASSGHQTYNFSAPGIKFTSGYVSAQLDNSGAQNIGEVTIWGYEE